MKTASGRTRAAPISTGIEGLDDILHGGLTPHRMYLCEGVPGSGKTTLGMQFLAAGAALGESVLYVTLSESSEELQDIASSHGWDLEGITLRELIPSERSLEPDDQYTVFHPSEVELTETTKMILQDVEKLKPSRIVFDSLSELRLLAGNSLRYRRQILALKQFFAGRGCTVMLLDDLTATERDLQVQSISHGVISLEQMLPEYGSDRRRLRVVKFRGRKFRGGYHDYAIRTGGLQVFPRLVAAEHRRDVAAERISSGNAQLDELLGGGIELGTSTLVVGPPGTGKSSLAAQLVAAAAQRGQKSAMFIFDESTTTLFSRTHGMGIDLEKHAKAGLVSVQPVDPAELSPGEFAQTLRDAVERNDVKVIVIDSINGYLNATPEERFLTTQLHEILSYLGQHGVATLLVGAHQGFIGPNMQSPVDTSYLADAVILLRYYEAEGEVRQAVSIVKKRGSLHERTIRDFRLTSKGIHVGKPLRDFRGILTGVPIFIGERSER
ncbi:MAG TPA: ATPase domain-containing protein [Steroidobacteraceae bacterium]|nr:ATPase domain-containing protein [Steroidobacteraceae bacterium]